MVWTMGGARPEGKFQDHYLVLGIKPKASMEDIHQAYSKLAKMYHPSNTQTGDEEKFKSVNMAYEVLSDPATRRMFDEMRPDDARDEVPEFDADGCFATLTTEVSRRLAILCLLYDRRRFRPITGSLSQRHLEQMVACTSEQLQLSIFYLQKKNLLTVDDKSSYLITVEGMDYLEKQIPDKDVVISMLKPRKPAPEPEVEPASSPSDAGQQIAALQQAIAKEAPAPVAESAPPIRRFQFQRK